MLENAKIEYIELQIKKIDYLQKGVDNLLCLVYNVDRKSKERNKGKGIGGLEMTKKEIVETIKKMDNAKIINKGGYDFEKYK